MLSTDKIRGTCQHDTIGERYRCVTGVVRVYYMYSIVCIAKSKGAEEENQGLTLWLVCEVDELGWFCAASSNSQIAAHLEFLTVLLLQDL